MRWSIIRLIWFRELQDQLRDRRTVFTIIGLPLLIYPLMSILVLVFAKSLLLEQTTIGIVTSRPEIKSFPLRDPSSLGKSADSGK